MSNTITQPAAASHATQPPWTLAIIGVGEVGRSYATAFVRAGHQVKAFDPYNTEPLPGVLHASSPSDAVRDADAVLVLTGAAASHDVARATVDALRPGALYADFTSSAPAAKQALAHCLASSPDVLIADVAILGPVIKDGAATPLMAAGPGGALVARLMGSVGATVEVTEGGLGAAMGHKLLRSVFMKGLAAVIVEAVEAGRAAGFEAWIRDQIARQLAGDGQATIDRFERGSRLHGVRRALEMEAAAEYLHQLGTRNTMTTATADHLRQLVAKSPAVGA